MTSDVKVTRFTLRQAWKVVGSRLVLVGPVVVEQDGKRVYPEWPEPGPSCRCAWGPSPNREP